MVQIICAGFQKTGTKSLSRALEKLDYKGKKFGQSHREKKILTNQKNKI